MSVIHADGPFHWRADAKGLLRRHRHREFSVHRPFRKAARPSASPQDENSARCETSRRHLLQNHHLTKTRLDADDLRVNGFPGEGRSLIAQTRLLTTAPFALVTTRGVGRGRGLNATHCLRWVDPFLAVRAREIEKIGHRVGRPFEDAAPILAHFTDRVAAARGASANHQARCWSPGALFSWRGGRRSGLRQHRPRSYPSCRPSVIPAPVSARYGRAESGGGPEPHSTTRSTFQPLGVDDSMNSPTQIPARPACQRTETDTRPSG